MLIVFETLMHERSVTRAAEKLFLGQPAISAALARLHVGALAPDGLGRYVQIPGESQIRIIPAYQTRAPLAAMAVDVAP